MTPNKKAKPEEGHEEEELVKVLVEDPCIDIGPPDVWSLRSAVKHAAQRSQAQLSA